MDTCMRGHPFTDENTYVFRGRRHCRACRREMMRRYRKGTIDPRPIESGAVVYFIQDENGNVKIGRSLESRLGERLSDLQSGNAQTLTLMGVRPGDVRLETALHRRFKHLHVRGEWFRLTPEIVEQIVLT